MNVQSAFPVQPGLVTAGWGGVRLSPFGFPAPGGTDPIAIAHVTGPGAMVSRWNDAPIPLEQLVHDDPARFGDAGATAELAPTFPILAAFVSTGEARPTLMHPATGAPRAAAIWHILAADPSSTVQAGFDAQPNRADAPLNGAAAGSHSPRTLPATAGVTLVIPEGIALALGGGVLAFTLERPGLEPVPLASASGLLARELPTRPPSPLWTPGPIAPLRMPAAEGQRELLAATRGLALERITLHVGELLPITPGARPETVTCLGGVFRIDESPPITLQRGESVIVPAGGRAFIRCIMPGVLLRFWAPDLEQDIVRPARAAAISPRAIAALSAPLDDLATVLF